MAITSMTGFARADGASDTVGWHWEIKSVNGKGFDTRCRMPGGYEVLEPAVRKIAAQHVRRGNLQINLQINRETGANMLRVNEEALAQVLQLAENLRKRLEAPPLTVEGVLSVRGVLETGEPEDSDEAKEARQTAMLESFAIACESLAQMRQSEGEKLAEVIGGQLDVIEELTEAARDCPARTAGSDQGKAG